MEIGVLHLVDELSVGEVLGSGDRTLGVLELHLLLGLVHSQRVFGALELHGAVVPLLLFVPEFLVLVHVTLLVDTLFKEDVFLTHALIHETNWFLQ